MKKGFGLLEVLIAAVVLGFLIVGLNKLQMGNRESVLRVRARDAANIIAQHVLDSLGSIGINSLAEGANGVIIDNKPYKYTFEGKAGKVDMQCIVQVKSLSAAERNVFVDSTIKDKTYFTETNGTKFAKNLEATVSWDFKNSKQSIKVSKVVR
jgi:prepilin-type N-terminal cleavage/methylation domain-containing protein